MVGQNDTPKRLASLLDEVAVHEGTHQTLVEGVQVTRVSRPMHRTPVVYQPKIAVVGQGRKRGYLGDEVYTCDPFNYLVLSVPLPAECEWEASPEEPVLLVAINVEPTMLGEMILQMDEPPPPVDTTPRGISTTPMSEELGGAVIRLLECLKCPLDRRMLGRQTVREIVYRVLRGEQGGSLRALASRDEHFTRIAPGPEAHPRRVREAAQRRRAGEKGRDERFRLPPPFQSRNGQLPAPVPQANPPRPCEAAHGPRRVQREHRREGGRVREPVAVQPGVQAALRRDARRGGREDAGSPRGRLIPLGTCHRAAPCLCGIAAPAPSAAALQTVGPMPQPLPAQTYPLARPRPTPQPRAEENLARFGPTSMRKPLSRPERDDGGTSQTSIRHHPRRRSAMRGYAVAPIQYRGVAMRHVGPRDAT
jgi:hypothetical protein